MDKTVWGNVLGFCLYIYVYKILIVNDRWTLKVSIKVYKLNDCIIEVYGALTRPLRLLSAIFSVTEAKPVAGTVFQRFQEELPQLQFDGAHVGQPLDRVVAVAVGRIGIRIEGTLQEERLGAHNQVARMGDGLMSQIWSRLGWQRVRFLQRFPTPLVLGVFFICRWVVAVDARGRGMLRFRLI